MVGGQCLTQSSTCWCHQQVEDCVRRCPPTMCWPRSTSWRLCQKLSSYQVLTSINKLKIVLDVVLPCTDLHLQVDDCVRRCPPTMYWPPSTSWRFCQTLSSSYHVLTSINKLMIVSDVLLLLCTDLQQQVEDCVRRCPPTIYWPPSTSWRLCQTLSSSYHVLTSINKLMIVSDVVLLSCIDLHQQVEDFVRRCPPIEGQRLTQSSTCWWRSVHGRRRTTSDKIFNLLMEVNTW
jgi:hypothetical protein